MRNFLIASLMLATACKGKPAHREPPANAIATTGSASGSDGKRAAPDLALPSGPGTPPLKTTRTLGRADYEKLQALDYPGFNKQPHGLNDTVMEVRQMTKDHPRLWATVTITPCTPDTCWPMTLDDFKKHEPELKKLLGDLAPFVPGDVDWEIGQTNLHGQPLIYTYQLGQHAGSGDEGGGSFMFSDAYALYYNDGKNMIRVVAEYKDDPVKTKELMAKQAPKDDLALLAISFLDVYTHAWPTS